MKKRNVFVSKQLAASGLKTVNVGGDGNCYYRALSIGLYRHENQHLQLRQSIVQHILDMASAGDSLPGVSMVISNETVRQQLADIMTAGVWAGEEMIIATAAYLRRPVHVYTYTTIVSSCPRVYGPLGQCADGFSPVPVAFFLPRIIRLWRVSVVGPQ